jgi:hypothetical protein
VGIARGEGGAQRGGHINRNEIPTLDEEHEVHQIFHARVYSVGPRMGVCVDLLRELLGLRYGESPPGGHSSERKEVISGE